MPEILKYADLHVHSTLVPFINKHYSTNEGFTSVWQQRLPSKREADNDIIHFTEADFLSLVMGQVKFAFTALYPLEQGWFQAKRLKFIFRLFAKFVTHFPYRVIKIFQGDNYNYFELLKAEGEFLVNQTKLSKLYTFDGIDYKFKARIPHSKQELQSYMQEVTTLIVIPTIEGITALLPTNAKNVETVPFEVIESNINFLKNSEYRPFFITLSHHFYNGMCGHAKSFGFGTLRMKIVGYFIDQSWGMTADLSTKCRQVIEKLLGIGKFQGEKRILIDIKHLNTISRQQYFEIIEQHNKAHPNDKIPIIASHVGYSGKHHFKNTTNIKMQLSNEGFTNSTSYFNESYINLSDTDVEAIFKSEGIIGINLDERILSNKQILKKSKKIKNSYKRRKFWSEQIVRNITAMAKVIFNSAEYDDQAKSRVWDMFAIGSDYDGFINPVDSYVDSISFIALNEDLPKALYDDKIFQSYNFGLTAEDLTKKIMGENVKNFLIKHFKF